MTYSSTLGASPRRFQRRITRGVMRGGLSCPPGFALRRRPKARTVATAIADYDEQLGFSLKPPKKVRRFIKKHKTALLVGAGILTAGILAPGAALAVGKGALTAGKFVGKRFGAFGRGAVKLGGKLLPRGGASTPPIAEPPEGPIGPPPPPAPEMPQLSIPSGGGGGGGGGVQAGSEGGGEGGGGDETALPADQAEAKPAGIPPVLMIAGLGLLGLMLVKRRR